MIGKDPFYLIFAGEYDEAIKEYTKQIEGNPDTYQHYSNRSLAYLNLGKTDEALKDMQKAEAMHNEQLKLRSDVYLQQAGVIIWLMGKEYEALEVWQGLVQDFQKKKINYSDLVGGVETGCLLWFGSVRNNYLSRVTPKAIEFLKERAATKKAGFWPGPLAKFVIDAIAEKELLRQAESIKELRTRHLCQAYFYIAAKAFASDDSPKYAFYLRKILKLDENKKIQKEYYLAKYELGRINQEQ